MPSRLFALLLGLVRAAAAAAHAESTMPPVERDDWRGIHVGVVTDARAHTGHVHRRLDHRPQDAQSRREDLTNARNNALFSCLSDGGAVGGLDIGRASSPPLAPGTRGPRPATGRPDRSE